MQRRPVTRTVYRIGRWLTASIILILLVLEALTVTRALSSPEQPAAQPETRIPDTAVNPYGANMFLEREVEAWKRDKTLAMAAEAGIGWVKLQFPWDQIEPQHKGEFVDPSSHNSTWTKFDQIVSECERYGLRIVARLDRPPAWSRRDNTLPSAPPDNYADYGDFVYEFVKHYRGRIQYIQIWNEPNIYPEWGNRPVEPAEYVALLKIAYQRAKEADPTIKVLAAPLAYTLGQEHPETGKWISMNDLDYLEGMYAAGAADYFDILSVNAFGFDKPPEDPPAPDKLNFQRIVLQRRIMEQHNDGNKAVWFNEFGWNAAPATMEPQKLIWQRVSEDQQAEYTVRAIQMAREEWPWAGVFFIWYFRQVGNITPDQAEYYFRMVDIDFTTRKVYDAIQRIPNKEPLVFPGTYEESDTAFRYAGDWEVILDAQTSAQAYRQTKSPEASLSLTFYGNQVSILTRCGPLDGAVDVQVDGQPVSGLEQVDGKSLLKLTAPEASFQWVTVWSQEAAGQHTLVLTLQAPPPEQGKPSYFVLDAIRVENRAQSFPWLRVSLLALLIAALVILSLLFRHRTGRAERP